MIRLPITLLVLSVASATASAQFDYGVSAGGVLTELHAKDMDNPHVTSEVWNVGRTAFSAAAFYRERYSDFVDLGFDLLLAHRSFNTDYSEGGLGGGVDKTARAELDLLYIGVKPEVRLDAKRYVVVRFGLMAGMLVGGSAKGTSRIWSVMGQGSLNNEADLTRDFSGDFRFAFGFGFRAPVGERWAITFDPEATIALTSMLTMGAGMRGSDIGLRIGLSRRSNGKSLSALFKADREERNAAPIW